MAVGTRPRSRRPVQTAQPEVTSPVRGRRHQSPAAPRGAAPARPRAAPRSRWRSIWKCGPRPNRACLALVTGEATRLPNAVVLTGPLEGFAAGDDGVGGRRGGRRRTAGPSGSAAGGTRLPRSVPSPVRHSRPPFPSSTTSAPPPRQPGLGQRRCVRAAGGGLPPGLARRRDHRGRAAHGPRARPHPERRRHAGRAPGDTAGRRLGGRGRQGRWLADWLAAAVTFDARTRTTPISATLLHCAARGEAGLETIAVLRGLTGRQPLEPAVHRLLRLGHTSGADLAWGIRTGVSAVLELRERDAR